MLNLKSLLTQIVSNLITNKNLLRGTKTLYNGSGTWITGTFRNSGSGGTIAYNQTITPPSGYNLPSVGAIITATSANTQIGFCQDQCPIEKRQITQSVWVKGSNGDRVDLQPIWSGTSGETESGAQSTTLTDSNWHFLTYTKTPNYAHTSVSLGYIYYYAAAANNKLQVIAPKVEYNNIATSWPENDTMVGILRTSFKNSAVFGSKEVSQTTAPNLINTLNGVYRIGSVYITTNYIQSTNFMLPSGWYNYISLPDNIILFGMTNSYGIYRYYYGASQWTKISNQTPVKGNMSNTATTYYQLNGAAGTHYYYIKSGNIVTVNFNVKCNSAGTRQTFATGLPKYFSNDDLTNVYTILACETAGNYKPMSIEIDANGKIIGSGGTAGNYYYGSVTYITYED